MAGAVDTRGVPRLRTLAAFVLLLLVAGCGPSRAAGSPAGDTGAPPIPISVTFRTPGGFHEATGYAILVPLTEHRTTEWRVPAGPDGLDVIFVNSYVLPEDTGGWSDARRRAEVGRYAELVRARAPRPPTTTTVAGYRAYQQHVDQPDGRATLHYDATYVFTGTFLVQVGCQYDTRKALIRRACAGLLPTLRIGAV